MKPYEIATAVAIMVVAAVAMFDSRAGMFIEPGATNIASGFYPFWSAAMIFVAAGLWAVRQARNPKTTKPPYEGPQGREGLRNVVKVMVPMIVATVLILWLGLYIVAALYLGFFGWYVGRYRWYWIVPAAVVTPVVLFFVFERFFRVPLPKSLFYVQGILPF